MKILWLCDLIPDGIPNMWRPRIEEMSNRPTGSFPCVWVTMDANRPNKFAAGSAEVTAEQLAQISLDNRIHYSLEANWEEPWINQPANWKAQTRASMLLSGFNPTDNQSVAQAWDGLMMVIGGRGIGAILSEMQRNFPQ